MAPSFETRADADLKEFVWPPPERHEPDGSSDFDLSPADSRRLPSTPAERPASALDDIDAFVWPPPQPEAEPSGVELDGDPEPVARQRAPWRSAPVSAAGECDEPDGWLEPEPSAQRSRIELPLRPPSPLASRAPAMPASVPSKARRAVWAGFVLLVLLLAVAAGLAAAWILFGNPPLIAPRSRLLESSPVPVATVELAMPVSTEPIVRPLAAPASETEDGVGGPPTAEAGITATDANVVLPDASPGAAAEAGRPSPAEPDPARLDNSTVPAAPMLVPSPNPTPAVSPVLPSAIEPWRPPQNATEPPASSPPREAAPPRVDLSRPPALRESADRDLITDVLKQLRQAYADLDAAAAKAIWPGVDERALHRAFQNLLSQELVFVACEVTITGTAADAACPATSTYVARVGSREPLTVNRTWFLRLEKARGTWTIVGADVK